MQLLGYRREVIKLPFTSAKRNNIFQIFQSKQAICFFGGDLSTSRPPPW